MALPLSWGSNAGTRPVHVQEAMTREGNDIAEVDDAGSGISSPAGDEDFDQYLRELNAGEEGTGAGTADGDHDKDGGASTPDLSDYVKDLH